MTSIDQILSDFQPITLSEMDGVTLMNRTDTKFMMSASQLLSILPFIKKHYRVLDIRGVRQSRYETLYYDTKDFLFYRRHHSGKKNRLKIRKRKYIDSDVTFLEVKFKSNKDRTIKDRTKLPGIEEHLDKPALDFIKEESSFEGDVEPKLWNSFKRITLVGSTFPERITLDVDLHFRSGEREVSLPHLAIVEVKQSRFNRNSPVMALLKSNLIRPESISKYCLGVAMLDMGVKTNGFKDKLIKIKKIENGRAA